MNILNIIDNKRNGMSLTHAEICYFIQGVTDGSIADYQITALLMAIVINGMDDDETYLLTLEMANSGDMMDYKSYGIDRVFDKHSTGGVGDSVSLILVPLLASMGYNTGKMSGRGLGLTGGTIDKLESIPGFNTSLSIDGFINQIKTVGCSIIGQTMSICPADKKLYALRDVSGTVMSIPLIASSIMSKKIAGGATDIVIDVKCGSGAFMKNIHDAEQLGELMKSIGNKFKIHVDYIISGMDSPLSNYIGNSLEVYGAIEVLHGQKNRLYDLTCVIITKLLQCMGMSDIQYAIDKAIESGAAYAKFREMVIAQGGDISYIDMPNQLLSANCRMEVLAQSNGYISAINAEDIARITFDMGGGRINKNDAIDYSVGVKIIKSVGDQVEIDEPIAEMYYNNYGDIVLLEALSNAFKIIQSKS